MVPETFWILPVGLAVEVFGYIDSVFWKNNFIDPEQSYSKNVEDYLPRPRNEPQTETILDSSQNTTLRSLHYIVIDFLCSFANIMPTVKRLHGFVHFCAGYVLDVSNCVF